MALQVPGQAARGHQRQDAPKLTASVFASQRDAFTAVFCLQRSNPAGVLVDDGIWMTGQERFPSCVGAQVGRYRAQPIVLTHGDRSINTRVRLQGCRYRSNRASSSLDRLLGRPSADVFVEQLSCQSQDRVRDVRNNPSCELHTMSFARRARDPRRVSEVGQH